MKNETLKALSNLSDGIRIDSYNFNEVGTEGFGEEPEWGVIISNTADESQAAILAVVEDEQIVSAEWTIDGYPIPRPEWAGVAETILFALAGRVVEVSSKK